MISFSETTDNHFHFIFKQLNTKEMAVKDLNEEIGEKQLKVEDLIKKNEERGIVINSFCILRYADFHFVMCELKFKP